MEQKTMTDRITSKFRSRLRRAWSAWRLRKLLDVDKTELTRLGTAHGGWTLPTAAAQSTGTAVCVGAGEDISFDVELNKRGLTVFTVDPTPRAMAHSALVLDAANGGAPASINRSPVDFYALECFDKRRFSFVGVGLWSENKSMRFFAPKDESHVSHSVVNLQHTDRWFEAECMTLEALCESLNICKIDILKLDIEGGEHAVLQNVIARGLLPNVLCVEFDEIRNPLDSGYMGRIRETIHMLKTSGYRFRHIENSNLLFLR
jgi:hypothetical protein